MHRGTRAGGHEGISLNGMIFLSFLVHLLVLSVFFFSRSFLASPKWTFGPVYSVQLVDLPADFPDSKEILPYKEMVEKGMPVDTVVQKESISDIPSVPIYTAKVNSKPLTGLESLPETIRRNIQAKANLPVSDTSSKEKERITPHAPLPQAKPNEEELNAKMKTYYVLLWSRIKGLWTLPRGILPDGNIETIVHAKILRDGTVINVGFEKRSGNRYFDDSALRAVKKMGTLPPLPEEIKEGNIEVGIRFHSSKFR